MPAWPWTTSPHASASSSPWATTLSNRSAGSPAPARSAGSRRTTACAVATTEVGFEQQQIQDSAYRHQQLVESGERVIVGVNRFNASSQSEVHIPRMGADLEAEQVERVRVARRERDQAAVDRSLDGVRRAAEGDDNLLPLMRNALAARATVGEVCNALRQVFGVYQPTAVV